MTATGIQIQGITKRFGTLVAVNDLSFTVAPGEIFGLLGPNGAGKTTTLRILSGLLTASAGQALIDGASALSDPLEVKRKLGYLTAETALYRRLTPRELLRFFARLNGLDKVWIESRIETLSQELGLEDFLDRRCEKLSSGQKQRTAIGRALVHDPAVLVFDEPTATLDVLSAQFILKRLRLEAERGKAVLLSTHHMAEAELVCDRIGIIHRGELRAEGTVASLRERTGADSLAQAFLALVSESDSPGEGAAP